MGKMKLILLYNQEILRLVPMSSDISVCANFTNASFD